MVNRRHQATIVYQTNFTVHAAFLFKSITLSSISLTGGLLQAVLLLISDAKSFPSDVLEFFLS